MMILRILNSYSLILPTDSFTKSGHVCIAAIRLLPDLGILFCFQTGANNSWSLILPDSPSGQCILLDIQVFFCDQQSFQQVAESRVARFFQDIQGIDPLDPFARIDLIQEDIDRLLVVDINVFCWISLFNRRVNGAEIIFPDHKYDGGPDTQVDQQNFLLPAGCSPGGRRYTGSAGSANNDEWWWIHVSFRYQVSFKPHGFLSGLEEDEKQVPAWLTGALLVKHGHQPEDVRL